MKNHEMFRIRPVASLEKTLDIPAILRKIIGRSYKEKSYWNFILFWLELESARVKDLRHGPLARIVWSGFTIVSWAIVLCVESADL
jgi:hypothetical protein